jgi:butyrate kinase
MSQGRDHKVLVINPGSTSTKVALFAGDVSVREASLPTPPAEPGAGPWAEFSHRLEGVSSWMKAEGIKVGELAAVVGRGGLLRPVEGGTYRVTEKMLADARGNRQGVHASNLGCALAQGLADEANRERGILTDSPRPGIAPDPAVPAFVVDPVSTDEFGVLARLSGLPEISRRSLSHALSIHSLVREVLAGEGRMAEGSCFVVAHMGGGISVCPVVAGRILDANNANSGGPFSPSRAGGLPTQELLELAGSGKYTGAELREMTLKRGGLVAYLGTDDAREVEERIRRGDEEARLVYQAMAYQIAKEIGAMATVVKGEMERILLTGGLAASSLLTGWIRERVDFLAPVEVWSEVGEMEALAKGALRVLTGEEEAKEY